MRVPFVQLSIGGTLTGLGLGTGITEFAYRDAYHGETDELSVTMADKQGLWRSTWGIDEGTWVAASIGYTDGAIVPCGDFVVDEPSASGDGSGGDTVTFGALSAAVTEALRTKRSEAYEKMTLKAIVERVAGRHGLTTILDVPELTFERITQDRTSDLEFLTRLADDYGCYFTIKGRQLVFMARAAVEAAAPIALFELVDGTEILSWSLRKSTHDCYKAARHDYLDPRSKKKISVEKADGRVRSGDTLTLDDRVESRAQADCMCGARLARENERFLTGTLSMVGNPLMVAGQVIQLGATFGLYAGRWLVTASTHRMDGQGYVTEIDVRGIADA